MTVVRIILSKNTFLIDYHFNEIVSTYQTNLFCIVLVTSVVFKTHDFFSMIKIVWRTFRSFWLGIGAIYVNRTNLNYLYTRVQDGSKCPYEKLEIKFYPRRQFDPLIKFKKNRSPVDQNILFPLNLLINKNLFLSMPFNIYVIHSS